MELRSLADRRPVHDEGRLDDPGAAPHRACSRSPRHRSSPVRGPSATTTRRPRRSTSSRAAAARSRSTASRARCRAGDAVLIPPGAWHELVAGARRARSSSACARLRTRTRTRTSRETRAPPLADSRRASRSSRQDAAGIDDDGSDGGDRARDLGRGFCQALERLGEGISESGSGLDGRRPAVERRGGRGGRGGRAQPSTHLRRRPPRAGQLPTCRAARRSRRASRPPPTTRVRRSRRSRTRWTATIEDASDVAVAAGAIAEATQTGADRDRPGHGQPRGARRGRHAPSGARGRRRMSR